LFYIDNDARRSAEVGFRFAGATDVKLDHLLSENVVDELTIPKDLAAPVRIESAYGFEGSFLCESIEVTEVTKG
jgi:hypothetical protein